MGKLKRVKNRYEGRRVAVILGMHRSGTSLLAKLLHELGVDLGTNLMPADEWNEAGYWERKDILALHERILEALNLRWDHPRLTLPLPAGWKDRPAIQELKIKLAKIVRSEVGRSDGLWGFKDPRTAVLLPLWSEIFEELGIDPVYLLAVRHPGAVAASLRKRNGIPSYHAQLLWLKTNLDALSFCGNNVCAVVDYDRWFRSGLKQAQSVLAALDLTVDPEKLAEAVQSVVQPPLRHHEHTDIDTCSPIVERLHAILSNAATTGAIPAEVMEINRSVEGNSEFVSLWTDFLEENEKDLQFHKVQNQGFRKLNNIGALSLQQSGGEWITFPALPSAATGSKDLNRGLRVCVVSPEFIGPYRNGGIGTACTSLGQALARAGHEVTLLYARGRYCENHSVKFWQSHYAEQGIRFVPLPDGSATFTDTPWYLVTAYRIYEWLREEDLDVIHFTEMMGPGYYCFLAKKQGTDFQNTLLCTGTHSPTLWIREANREIVSQTDDLGLDYIERKSVALADVVWSPSHYLLNWMRDNKWTLPEACFVQQYILPYSARFVPAGESSCFFNDIKEIVFFGRLETRKGLILFCDAVDRLTQNPVLEEIKITFMGRHAEVMGKPSEQYIRERATDWPCSWEIISNFDQPQAINYLQQPSRVALIASPVDNSPNTVLECLGGRIPFLASRTGGIPELISPEHEKDICFDWSADDLARKLQKVFTNGICVARPAVDIEANEIAWIRWHENLADLGLAGKTAAGVLPNRKPIVSVCVSHRDSPAHLEQTIQSIQSQDYPEIELILADYGSTSHEALAMLEDLEFAFASAGRNLTVCRAFEEGMALNLAAREAKGEFLLFMDTNSIAGEGAVTSFMAAVEATGADILTCPVDLFFGDGPNGTTQRTFTRWLPLGGSLGAGLFRNCFGIANILIRRDVLAASGGFGKDVDSGVDIRSFLAGAQLAGAELEVVPGLSFRYRGENDGKGIGHCSRESHLRTAWVYERSLPEGLQGLALYAQGVNTHEADALEDTMKYYGEAVPVMILVGQARSLVEYGHSEAATRMVIDAVRSARQVKNEAFLLDTLIAAGKVLLDAHQPNLALSLLTEAINVAQKMNCLTLVRQIQNAFDTIAIQTSGTVPQSGSRLGGNRITPSEPCSSQ